MELSKIDLIELSINSIKGTDAFIKKSKIQRLQYYKDNVQKLESLPIEKLQAHNFKIEIVNHAYNLRKLALLPKITKQVIKLERHQYAPELNVSHFTKNRFLKVPQKTTLEDALTHLINVMNIDDLKTLTK